MDRKVVAVDVGGTFIDLVSVDPVTGGVSIEKQPATPDRLAEELVEGLVRLEGSLDDIDSLLHGSTVAINALVQRKGASVGLITTRGFRDVLELGRGNRPSIYDWVWVPPVPLVPRPRRREVAGRLGPAGEEIAPLDLDELHREVDALMDAGAESIAICFLHAYANPRHEQEAANAIHLRHPSVSVTVSSEVAAEWHEYERTSTAVINAYVGPVFATYLRSLQERLTEAGMTGSVGVMQSSGGSMKIDRATELPVRTLSSGPAGGVLGASRLAGRLGHADVICADVGGTTYDVAVIEGGRIQERTQTEVIGLPVLAPTIDVVSIGAGGGSIAWFDDTGALCVGPRSAGARPGPACFGFGGDEPTVTDCQLVLGHLDADRFLGSRMKLDVASARTAVDDRIATRLELSVEAAALGVLRIAESTMANALHSMTVERGLDPRDFVLYAYGGGGGLFAAATAADLGMTQVVIPQGPANFSAWGISTSARREDASTTWVRLLDEETLGAAFAEMERLTEQLIGRFETTADDVGAIQVERRIDLRFEGQEHTVTVEVDRAWDATDTDALADRFVDRHRQLHGHGERDAVVELVTLRCRGTLPAPEFPWPEWSIVEPTSPRAERTVLFGTDGPVATGIYDRDALAVEQSVPGPAIIEEWTSTTLVPPGWVASTDRHGDLVLTDVEEGG